MLAAGMLLLGTPALVLAATSNLALILLACPVRGIGFAITCVSGYALTVSLIPPQRRGEGLALIGVVSGVPSVMALPAGVWLAGHAGFRVVFGLAATAAIAPYGDRCRVVRRAGRRHRIPGRVRCRSLGDGQRDRTESGDESPLARTSTAVCSGQKLIEFADGELRPILTVSS